MTGRIINQTLALANTEYAVTLPSNFRLLAFQCRTAVDIRFAWTPGQVVASNYFTLKSGSTYWMDQTLHPGESPILFLATGNAGAIVEVEVW